MNQSSDSSPNSPSDKDISKLVNEIVRNFPRIVAGLTDFFGVELEQTQTPRLSQADANDLVRKIRRFVELQAELSKVQAVGVTTRAEKRRARALTNDLLRTLLSRKIPRGEDAIRWLKWSYREQTMPPYDIRFLRRTAFGNYRHTLLTLAISVGKGGRGKLAEALFSDFGTSDDGRALVQSIVQRRLLRDVAYLDKTRRFSQKTVERLVSTYHELAGAFEKLLSVLVGLVEIDQTGTLRPYEDIKKRQLSTNLERLHNEPRFARIAGSFNKTIRNSVAHKTFAISPAKETILFHDLKKHFRCSYERFLHMTRELGAVTLVLLQARVFFEFVRFEEIDRKL